MILITLKCVKKKVDNILIERLILLDELRREVFFKNTSYFCVNTRHVLVMKLKRLVSAGT